MKKKRFLLLLLCFTALLSLICFASACKPKEENPAVEYWTVTIDLNDGSTPATQQVVKGEKLTGVSEPTRDGYTFEGWKANDADWTMDTAITADITIVAQWTEITSPGKEYWTVTIDLNDGSTPTTQQVQKGGRIIELADPTREGYTFAGWKANGAVWTTETEITANITIVAQWTKNQPAEEYWTVTINLNDGSTPTTQQVVKGEKLTGVAEPTREGYTFAGWKANDAAWTMDTAITADITIVAQWTENQPVKEYWTVTIDLNDGSTPATQQVEKGEKLTDVAEPTREGYAFAGWKANGADWTMDTAITADITIVAQWTQLSAYDAFVSKGNIVYASDFTDSQEIPNTNTIHNSEEAYGKWFGSVNDSDEYDETNKVTVENGYLDVIDNSSKTTYAYLILDPVFASVVEVKAVVQATQVAGSWSIFTLTSPYSSSEYLLSLRTNSAKQICLQTRVYNETTEEYADSVLPDSGFVYVENKDIVIEATVDLSTGAITLTLSQEGATSKTFTATIDATGYMAQGLPLSLSGVKVMTAGSASRSVKIDWLGIRIESENTAALKEFALNMLAIDYEDFDKTQYTQQLELLEKAYADGVAAINAATTNAEVLAAINEAYEALYDVKNDEELAAADSVPQALAALAALKEEHKDNYTITKDSEDDYFANKESFEELFTNAERDLENPYSVEYVQYVVDNVRSALVEGSWLQNDAAVLANYRQHLVNEIRNYAYENGYSSNMSQVEEVIVLPLEETLATVTTKAAMKDEYNAALTKFDEIEDDEKVLADAKAAACTEIDEYAVSAIEGFDETADFDAEVIALIGSVRDNAKTAINAATGIYGTNGVQDLIHAAMNEITALSVLAGEDLSAAVMMAQDELDDYIKMNNNYQDDPEVCAALDAVNAEDAFDGLTTVAAVREKLAELKGKVDAIIAAAEFAEIKEYRIADFEDIAADRMMEIMSEALQDEFVDLTDEWSATLRGASSQTELEVLFIKGIEALDNFLNGMSERTFKVTYTNAVGAVYVNYGHYLEPADVHVTGMTVTDIVYDGDLTVYDDMEVTLVMQPAEVDEDTVNWAADKNSTITSGVFADTEFFTLSQDATFVWKTASGYPSGYTIGWQSANFNEGENDVPIILTIKENLSSLKLHIGLADSNWSSTRSGLISFEIDEIPIIEDVGDADNRSLLFTEVVLEDLVCGDIITIYAHDLNSGSRIYIFDAEAKLDYSVVPKTVAIIWGDAEEPTMYSHIEVIDVPADPKTGNGEFMGWFDESGKKFEGGKLAAGNYTFTARYEYTVKLSYTLDAETFDLYLNVADASEIAAKLPKNLPDVGGNAHTGWKVLGEGDVENELSAIVVGSVDEPKEYTIIPVYAEPTLVTGITITAAEGKTTLEIGETVQLTAAVAPDDATKKTVTWTSSDDSVVGVDATGLVTAKKAGSVTITATAADGSEVTGTIEITVNAPAYSDWSLDFAGNKVGTTGQLSNGAKLGDVMTVDNVGYKTQISSGYLSANSKNNSDPVISFEVAADATFTIKHNGNQATRTFKIKDSNGNYVTKDGKDSFEMSSTAQSFELSAGKYTIEFLGGEHKITEMSLTYKKA